MGLQGTWVKRTVFGLLLLLCTWSCGKKKPSGPEPTTTQISDNVRVLGAKTETPLDSIRGTLFYFSTSGTTPSLAAGDIMVGEDGPGFLRRVRAVTFSPPRMTVSTDSASLTDAIVSGEMTTTIPLKWDRISLSAHDDRQPTAILADGVSITDVGLSLSGMLLYSGAFGELKITKGHVNFQPDLDIGFKIRNRKVEEFRAIASGSITLHADVALNASLLNLRGEKQLAKIPFAKTTVFIGPVPVVIVASLRFNGKYNIRAGTVVLATGFESLTTAQCGARYHNGTWAAVWERSITGSMHATDWDLKKQFLVEVGVEPEVSLELYGMAGPNLGIEPYLSYSAAHESACFNWDLVAGVRGELGFRVSVLSWVLANYHTELGRREMTLKTGRGCAENVIVPLAVGNRWGFTSGELLGITGTSVITHGGRGHTVYHWNWFDTPTTPGSDYYFVKNDAQGFWLMGNNRWTPQVQPSLALKYPVAAGDSWEYWDHEWRTSTCVATKQPIETPLGTFLCVVYRDEASPSAARRTDRGPRLFRESSSLEVSAQPQPAGDFYFFAPGLGFIGHGPSADGRDANRLVEDIILK